MNLFVCVKQVPDTETKIRLNSDNSGVDETSIKWILNPYDEFAVEEGIKLREAHAGSKLTIVSLGPKKRTSEAIRTALAMGADEGIVIDAPTFVDGYITAKALAAAIKAEGAFDLVLTGKLAIDDNNAYVSQAIAEELQIPHATVISKLVPDGNNFQVEREVEGGTREVICLMGPSLVAANKGLNTPRYASLPGIMKAKKKPIKEVTFADLGLGSLEPKVTYKSFCLPAEKPATRLLTGEIKAQVSELVRLLKQDAKVL